MKYGGYTGKFLTVDLGTGEFGSLPLTDELAEKYIGGRGFVAKLLYDMLPRGIDPLGPENVIVFATGPATGTMIPTASRIAIGVKSPLTGTISASYMGGHFGPALKYAGWDGIIITGVSEKPVALVVDDEKARLVDATRLWGKECLEAQALLEEELGHDFQIGTIGPGGENGVRYGTFMHMQHNAGRGGSGTVFGSKRLKAVAVRGSGGVSVAASTADYIAGCKALHDIIMENPVRPAFRWPGTNGMLPNVNEATGLPYRNHQDDRVPDVSTIHHEVIDSYITGREACSSCNVICGAVLEFERDGRSYRSERLDHESCWALGPLCGILDLTAIMEANYLCDQMGIDTMTAGSTIAWAMEMTEKGLLTKDETDGLDFTFGNADVLRPALLSIGAREGFGGVLALGSRGAARKLGKGEEYAMQVKGLEIAAYAPRGFTGMGVSYATTGRGADHNKAFTVAAEFLGVLGDYDRYSLEGKAELVKRMQDSTVMIDSLIMCMFTVDLGISVELYARCANLPTGMNLTADDVYTIGSRVNTLERLFNVEEGFTRADDALPRRFAEEAAPSDPEGHKLDVADVLDEYYSLRGWDADGVPTAAARERLGV